MSRKHLFICIAGTLLAVAAHTMAFAQSEDGSAQPQPAANGRFEALGDGTVRDSETGLIWAAKDNGGDVDWAAAQRYCESLGSGWMLPSVDELLRIYDPNEQQICLGVLQCKITPLIAVSGLTPWSRDSNGPVEAWYVYFADGQRYAYAATSSQGKRALCMRAP